MTANNLFARLQSAPLHVRKIVLVVTTASIMAIIVATWLLTLTSNANQLATQDRSTEASAFALFENGFFRKQVHYTR